MQNRGYHIVVHAFGISKQPKIIHGINHGRVGAAAAGAGYDKIQNECTSHSLAFAHFHLEIDYLHEDNHCVCK